MKLEQKIAVNYMRARLKMLATFSKKKAAQKAFELFCTPLRDRDQLLSAIFDTSQKLTLSINNQQVTGYRWNHPQPKKILILHGFASAARNFHHYVSPLIKKGYEVLAFDAPAHGESEGSQTNVLQYRSMIEEVNSRFGPIDAYMGHSFGGLAVSLALENIPHTEKTRLVLIAPATETSTAIDAFFTFWQLDDKVREEFEDLILKTGTQPVQWYSIARALQKIRATTLWIHDEGDDVTPLRDIQPIREKAYPHIQFMITNGWGHSRIYREPAVVDAVTGFVSGTLSILAYVV